MTLEYGWVQATVLLKDPEIFREPCKSRILNVLTGNVAKSSVTAANSLELYKILYIFFSVNTLRRHLKNGKVPLLCNIKATCHNRLHGEEWRHCQLAKKFSTFHENSTQNAPLGTEPRFHVARIFTTTDGSFYHISKNVFSFFRPNTLDNISHGILKLFFSQLNNPHGPGLPQIHVSGPLTMIHHSR